jgi:TetR/AcrR family transcriptional repressor of nem operon
MDAAERRIRLAGYHGFSYREIAADVGVKASSVHHHFPSKDLLAAAVARRYTDRFEAAVETAIAGGTKPIEAWRQSFRQALVDDRRMCLCGALGTGYSDLPPGVAAEARRFFERGLAALTRDGGLAPAQALRTLAILEGAMLVASVLGTEDAFDQATVALG